MTKILSVSGKPGLYELIKEIKNGFIVESLEDEKRFPVFSNTRVSSLEEISIFSTGEEDIPLKNVFKAISEKEEGKKSIDPKSDDDTLRDYFETVVPDYDKERVYLSDIRKVFLWYNILAEKGMLVFDDEQEEESKSAATSEEETAGTEREKSAESTDE